ncbi:hypothetical protein QEN19_001931 [Hanseniaspora menglaensis]
MTLSTAAVPSKDVSSVKNILIVGSGPTGIAALKAFKKENKFNKITVYEKRHDFGGLWNYVKPIIDNDSIESVPLIDSTKRIKALKTIDKTDNHVFDSAVYRELDTNVPKFLMEYNKYPFPEGTPLFPKKDVVLDYLISFAESNREDVTFNTEVTSIIYDSVTEKYKADILSYPFQDVESAKWDGEEYDAVVIASGNYDSPFIPNKQGLSEWFKVHKNSIIHSKNFDSPDQFKDVKGDIVIVGNSASGSDIAFQLATSLNKKIYQTTRRESGFPAPSSDKIVKVSDIDYLDSSMNKKSIKFLDGTLLENVEKIIFCTGFLKSFPFLDQKTISPFVDFSNGENVKPLYNHIIPVNLPTLAFIGLPKFVLPTRLSETQAAWLARVWTGRIELPSKDIQIAYHEWFIDLNGDRGGLHDLAFPADVQYSQRLNREIRQAKQANRGYFGLEWNGNNIKLRSSIKPLKEAYVKYYVDTGKRAYTIEELIENGYFEWPSDATSCVQVGTFTP